MKNKEEISSILATDCGSTTTKAILIEKRGGEFRLVVRGEAPTTVEAPVEDVTRGVINAVTEVQELAGRPLLSGDRLIKPRRENQGVDAYLSTSSAGGGLQMLVGGVVREMTAASAQRAALGAGAVVIDVIASNDRRLPHEKIERIRALRPDMFLLSGGVDGGTVTHVVEIAELIAAADPAPRLGASYRLPVIYAGNILARDAVQDILGGRTSLVITENIRPVLERENLGPARQEIQKLFLEHVMAHAPGYRTLMEWTDADIMPTPAAVGLIMQKIAEKYGINVLGVDIGGATTDVFSVFGGRFNRTVSANYGMSYSISNVFADATLPGIRRWLPFEADEKTLRNRVKNKMIRPTTIPQTLEDLMLEQAIAREALRLSFIQHMELATELTGVQQERTIADTFDQSESGKALVSLMTLDMLIGSGGVLSHAPDRKQAALMMMDAFLPEGVTQLAVDSIFMMPQLGVLSQIHPEAATQVFEKDCLILLGTCIAPVGAIKEGRKALTASFVFSDGKLLEAEVLSGDIMVVPLAENETAKVVLEPARGLNLGAGKGQKLEATVRGGVAGIILDCRGRRPFPLAENPASHSEKIMAWNKALGVF
ncbi:MAG: glutamate mutase L [bacterium]